jgi:hypothetical protein
MYAFRRLPDNSKTEQRDWPNGSWAFFTGTQLFGASGLRAHILQTLFGRKLSMQLAQTYCLQRSHLVLRPSGDRQMSHRTI